MIPAPKLRTMVGDDVRTLLNPYFYMSADDLAQRFANADLVTTALDLTGNQNSVTSFNTTARPAMNVTGINNKPSLDFTKSATYALSKALSTTPIYAPRSFAMVLSLSDVTVGSCVAWDMNISGGSYFQLATGGSILSFYSGTGGNHLDQTTTVNTPIILVGNVNGSSSYLSMNGVKVSGTLVNTSSSTEQINIGSDASHTLSYCPGMRIGMLALSQKVLTEQEHFELVNMLSAHYQIAVNLT